MSVEPFLDSQAIDDDLAPLVTSDDYEIEDLAFHRGNDWLMESDRAEIEFGVRRLFR